MSLQGASVHASVCLLSSTHHPTLGVPQCPEFRRVSSAERQCQQSLCRPLTSPGRHAACRSAGKRTPTVTVSPEHLEHSRPCPMPSLLLTCASWRGLCKTWGHISEPLACVRKNPKAHLPGLPLGPAGGRLNTFPTNLTFDTFYGCICSLIMLVGLSILSTSFQDSDLRGCCKIPCHCEFMHFNVFILREIYLLECQIKGYN